jgi:carbonic anhydrase/acetyltransferase-like protein (isoleucine patch superfamily)
MPKHMLIFTYYSIAYVLMAGAKDSNGCGVYLTSSKPTAKHGVPRPAMLGNTNHHGYDTFTHHITSVHMDYIAQTPKIGRKVYSHPSSVINGAVILGDDVSVWPQVVIRGDVHHISVGAGTNVQDHSVLHVTHAGPNNPHGHPLVIGANITIGHRVILHGCTLEDDCFIGMGSIVMDGATVESGAYLGAGCLVPPGKTLSSGWLYLGQPAKAMRKLTDDEKAFISYSAQHYRQLKDQYLSHTHQTAP